MSATNRSGSLTEKASPRGNHETTELSSFRSISISFLGKGFECPVLAAGDDGVEEDGEEVDRLDDEAPRVILRLVVPSIPVIMPIPRFGDVLRIPADCIADDGAGCNFITPAAIFPGTGMTMALIPPEETTARSDKDPELTLTVVVLACSKLALRLWWF